MPDQPSTPPFCADCRDGGTVCENHPNMPWGAFCCASGPGGVCEHGACDCGAGMPCPACCSPIPTDGTHSIGEAFVPDRVRTVGRA